MDIGTDKVTLTADRIELFRSTLRNGWSGVYPVEELNALCDLAIAGIEARDLFRSHQLAIFRTSTDAYLDLKMLLRQAMKPITEREE